MASIDSKMYSAGPDVAYEPGFRQMIEDHLSYLKNIKQSETIEIDNQVAYKHHGDLFGVLHSYRVPPHLHWIIMRINGYTSPMEYKHEHVVLTVPSPMVMNKLLQMYRTGKSK